MVPAMGKTLDDRIEALKQREAKNYARRHEALRMYEHDDLTYEEIGLRLGGLTRQRIQQLVAEARDERDSP